MSWTLEIKNYRALRSVRWSPDYGVSCLVGPNGVGKTTLLSVPELMARAAGDRGPAAALDSYGGPRFMKHVEAGDEPVILRVSEGDIFWQLEPSSDGQLWGEELVTGDTRYVRRIGSEYATKNGEKFPADERTLLNNLRPRPQDLTERFDGANIWRRLGSYRIYYDYDLRDLRQRGSRASVETHLHRNGLNALTVLRNWRDRRKTKTKFEFVEEGLRECFPFFDGLEFEGTQLITGRFIQPGSQEGIPLNFAPNGLLVALLHLTAVASADPGGIVAIDDIEISLHPTALYTLLDLIDEYAKDEGLTLIISTQSPMVLDWFEATPDRVWVMEPQEATIPIRLSQLRDQGWLSHFRLGLLFVNREFGAPQETRHHREFSNKVLTGRPALDRAIENMILSKSGWWLVVFEDSTEPSHTLRMTTCSEAKESETTLDIMQMEISFLTRKFTLPVRWDELVDVRKIGDGDHAIQDTLLSWWKRGARPHQTLSPEHADLLRQVISD